MKKANNNLYKRVIGIHGGVNSKLYETLKPYEEVKNLKFVEYNEYNAENIKNDNTTVWIYNSYALPFY